MQNFATMFTSGDQCHIHLFIKATGRLQQLPLVRRVTTKNSFVKRGLIYLTYELCNSYCVCSEGSDADYQGDQAGSDSDQDYVPRVFRGRPERGADISSQSDNGSIGDADGGRL